MPTRTDPPLTALARALAAVAGLTGVAVTAGWLLDVGSLQRVAPHLVAMAFNTAVCLTLLGAAWWLPRIPGLAAAGAATTIALLSLVEYGGRVDLHIDQLVVHNTDDIPHPGRMAGATAVCILLIGAGRIALLLERPRPVQVIAIIDLLITAMAVLGYAYGVNALYSVGPLSTIALHTALALHLLGIALLASVPGGLLPWVVRGSDAGGLLLRRLLPVALVGLPFIGWLRLRGEEAGLYEASFGLAIVVVASALLVSGVAWTAARALARVDRGRLTAIEDLRQLTSQLEERVIERVAQLEAHHARIAVLEDRERIAADLHDLVVQRLFAAGVQLQSVTALPDREAIQRRIDLAIDGIDGAIKDLRSSILELKSGRRHEDLPGEIRATLDAAQIVLGFRPVLTTEGPVEQAAVAVDDLLAVLREGLANVARHARATAAEVTVRVDGDRITLTIADNGVGIPAEVVDSGRRNMRVRAEQHGGYCTWRANEPHGTVVEWSIPSTADAGGLSEEVTGAPASAPATSRLAV